VRKLAWGIAEDTALGEHVDSTHAGTPTIKSEPPEAFPDSWASSSFDLSHGVDVSENADTVPAELLDELFQPHDDMPNVSGETQRVNRASRDDAPVEASFARSRQ
jgi:hypothetical protein